METLKHWSFGNVVRRSAPSAFNVSSAALGQSTHAAPTIAQLTLFLLWVTAVVMWLLRWVYGRHRDRVTVMPSSLDLEASGNNAIADLPNVEENGSQNTTLRKNAQIFGSQNGAITGKGSTEIMSDADKERVISRNSEPNLPADNQRNIPNEKVVSDFRGAKQPSNVYTGPEKVDASQHQKMEKEAMTFSKVKPPPTFDEFLKFCAMFGLIMLFFYLCDYKHEWPEAERKYSRDLFMFLVLLLFAVAGAFTLQSTQDKILNRDQTEEWKGWMQVMFVWYHYFRAAETYNYIRLFIACYVWMTGFGNFSFFWVRKDFSLWRFLKMLFRLNFLVVLTMLVTDNSYMLYYICAMHTYWFLSVYAFMGILPSWNQDRAKMAFKFVCYFVLNALVFDTPLREVVFKPFWFVLAYKGSMHEWLFRAGLDHYAAFVGMLCAYNYPYYEWFMNYLDKRHLNRRDYLLAVSIKLFLSGLLLVGLVMWYDAVMWREKYDYNKLHPYTSWVPILVYIFFRNLLPWLRMRYLGLFAFLGKITLETYISQLHIYMQYDARRLIVFIPGYPLMNFALASMIYLLLSHRMFHLTTEFSAFILPKDMKQVVRNAITGAVVIGLHVCFALLLREIRVF
ncbi:protein REDUCED WALL ACETYLATION 2-like [Acanthaster planci]|uniref:Protein REDUCED WALL ACETYLATION 2-like n=1 Tax=Acanthaster planci TaxID=133434 RepID=A0A8B7Y6S1_ACAPL|nr:protein REDUCED WALL ACETYLATION 2-like [Acanthaster planci]XP_022088913.1 protein REDUCED WALL ACETYLATION 2-like [Acanthaster planci]XP_022088914.1 protein REDUCED WALL ACETYLATION 2-like [Acanthaster planci]XP_022088915.1 protein REDUCED WALL ACETYLATION 2-like [Acanthaster planci]